MQLKKHQHEAKHGWRESGRSLHRIPVLLLLAITIATTLTSCGGAGSTTKSIPSSVAPTITTQPASQTIPINRAATFTVAATGTAPLLYQWYKNGAAIGNANAASYSTPIVTAADNNTTYSITVSNSAGSVTSSVATLFTGPRAPAIGDLRYLQLEQAPLYNNNGQGAGVELGSTTESGTGYLGDVLMLGANVSYLLAPNCNWNSNMFTLPSVLNNYSTYYETGNTNSTNGMTYYSYLQTLASSNIVIFSMDYRPPCQQIAVAYTQIAQPTAFDQRIEIIDPANLQTQVAADGAASRIVTAATFDDATGKVVLLSYGWQGDTTTAYESKAIIDQDQNVIADAEQFANQGYFVSAFGGNNHDGYAIIAMRVMGDTMPRPYVVGIGSNSQITNTKGNQPAIPETIWTPNVIGFNYPSGNGLAFSAFAEQ